MNYANSDLNRVLSVVAERHHGTNGDFTMDNLFYYKSHDGYQGYLNYYFYDKHSTNEYGDTSLHRILAMHVPGHVMEDFIAHMNRHRVLFEATGSNHYQQSRPPHAILCVDPPRIDEQNHAGATALHVAVCRNSWHAEEVAPILLRAHDEEQQRLFERGVLQPHEMKSLASIPMASGTYPLHIACGMHTTVRRDLLTTLLNADPSVSIRDDVNGDNAFSLLWKNVLRFNWARLMERGEPIEFIDHCAESLPTWQTIIGRDEYWKYSMLMLRSILHQGRASHRQEEDQVNQDSLVDMEQQIKLHHIAAIPRCPSLLIRMAIASGKFRLQLSEPDNPDGMLPLHHAAAALAYTSTYLPFTRSAPINISPQASLVGLGPNSFEATSTPLPLPLSSPPPTLGAIKAAGSVCLRLETVLDILSQAYPEAASTRDWNGRLPLHHALQSGKGWNTGIQTLFDAYPDGVGSLDPQTGLFPFMLAAAAGSSGVERKIGRRIDRRKVCNECTKEVLIRHPTKEEQDTFTTSFLLLKLCPEVLMHCIR